MAGFFLFPILLMGSQWAQAGDTVWNVNVQNPDGYVLESDFNEDGEEYDRDVVNTSTIVIFNRDGAPAGEVDYRLVYRILNEEGEPIPLGQYMDANFNLVTFYSRTKQITADFSDDDSYWTTFSFGVAVRGLFVGGFRIDHRQEHTVEVTVERDVAGDGDWVERGSGQSSPQVFYHFTNTDPDDEAYNVLARVEDVYYNRAYLVDTIDDRNTLEAEVAFSLRRWDNFDATSRSWDFVNITFEFVLREADTGDEVPLTGNTTSTGYVVWEFEDTSPREPYAFTGTHAFQLNLDGDERLDSPNKEYVLEVVGSHVDVPDGDPVPTNTVETPDERLLHFNGTLLFGGISATFDALGNHPEPGALGMGYVASQIDVLEGGGWIDGQEEFLFSDDATLDVQLLANGDAQVVGGEVDVLPEVEEGEFILKEIAGWGVTPSGLTLSSSGLDGNLVLFLPAGLGYRQTGILEDYFGPRAYLSILNLSSVSYNQDIEPADPSDLERDLTGAEEDTWFFDQSWPVAFRANGFAWIPDEGRFVLDIAEVQYVHETPLAHVESYEEDLVNPEEANRRSNERYFRFVNGFEGDAVFEPGSDGGVRSSFTLLFGNGDYRPHFPSRHSVAWADSGRIEVEGGQVAPENSYLDGVSAIDLAYNQDCPEGSCDDGSGEAELEFVPDESRLVFTRNGGLHANGELAVPAELQWGFIEAGVFAHETDFFVEASYHASGIRMDGSDAGDDAFRGAAAILLAGIDRDDRVSYELPGTEAYRLGHGDYAGLNFRVSDEPATLEGRTRMGGVPTDFDLTGRSKYYVRYSGVSGIHEAVAGTFPESLTIYGYNFAFTNFGLSFLSSENEESRTNGRVDVPGPSEFVQDFEELTLTCLGELDKAEPPEGDDEKRLTYWGADFHTLSIRFARKPDDCPVTSVLALGVDTGAAAFEERLAGELGFFPDGTLTSAADDEVEDGLDSRLYAPTQVRIEGPAEETYVLEPVATAYFNSYQLAPDGGSEPGFVSLAGLLGVPFFEAMQVHVHTRGRNPGTEGDAPHLAGGWPDAGWQDENEEHFFTLSSFDPENRGLPPDVAYPVYRGATGQEVEGYLVHARQEWLGIVPFNYPLSWDRITRSLRSYRPVDNDLLVLNIEHQVDYLSAENAELTFGARYDGLPRISLASAAFNIVDENLGVAQSITESAQAQVRDAIVEGMDDLAELIRDRLDDLLEDTLFSLTDDVIDEMFDELEDLYEDIRQDPDDNTVEEWMDEADGYVSILEEFLYDLQDDIEDQTTSRLIEELDKLSQGVSQGSGILREVDDRLETVQMAIDALIADVRVDDAGELVPGIEVADFELWLQGQGINVEVDAIVNGIPVDEDGRLIPEVDESDVEAWLEDIFDVEGGEWLNGLLANAITKVGDELEEGAREILQNLVRRLFHNLAPDLAGNLGSALDDLTSSFNDQLNGLLEEAEPAIDRIVEVLERVRDRIGEVRTHIADAEGIAEEIQDKIDGASEQINAVAKGVRERMDAFFEAYEEARPASVETLDDDFSPFEEYDREELKAMVREEISDRFFATELVGEIHTALKQRLYDLDAMAREAVDSAFQRVNVVMRDLVHDALDEVDQKINGLLGDLDALVGAGEIDGYAHINGDALRRLRLDGRFEWQVPDEVEFRGYLLVEQLNSQGTEGCEIDDVGDSVTEVTLGALDVGLGGLGGDGVRADVETKFSFATGPFTPRGLAGSLVMTDGEISFEAFAITEFGAAAAFGAAENYLSASTRLEFSEYELAGGVFFGRTCTLDPIVLWDPDVGDIVTDGGPFTGGYVYGEGWIPISETLLGIPASCMFRISAGVGAGAFYFVEGPTFGGKILAGVSGEALCAVSVKGELRMAGVKQGDDINFSGQGSVAGKVGKCRFCLKYEKTIRATYKAGEWDIDL